jgi:hypothetical protein
MAFSISEGVNAIGVGDSWRGIVREYSTWQTYSGSRILGRGVRRVVK